MEFALGVLHWPEAAFWSCSLRAYDRAVAGWGKANAPAPTGMTRSRLAELQAQFPDTPKR